MTPARRILIADDAAASRAVFEKLLTALGFQPVFAHDGREAVNLFVEFRDLVLILMDVRMPGLNGIKAAQEIRLSGLKNCMKVPIIGITAADGEAVRKECLASGMNEVLVKPIDPRLLVETIRRYVS